MMVNSYKKVDNTSFCNFIKHDVIF